MKRLARVFALAGLIIAARAAVTLIVDPPPHWIMRGTIHD